LERLLGSLDPLEDLLAFGFPHVTLWVFIASGEVIHDGVGQFAYF
jgi:hypothetical protein